MANSVEQRNIAIECLKKAIVKLESCGYNYAFMVDSKELIKEVTGEEIYIVNEEGRQSTFKFMKLYETGVTDKPKKEWFGYRHVSGQIIAKRYVNKYSLEDVKSSPYVSVAFGPFLAVDREEAIKVIRNKIKDGNVKNHL